MAEPELNSNGGAEGIEEARRDPGIACSRVVIEHVQPEIDAGRFPIKRVVGERVAVDTDAFADGHDELFCVLCFRAADETAWRQVPMRQLPNDHWRGEFTVERLGRYLYTVEAWPDHFHTWCRDLVRRLEAGQDVAVDLRIGSGMVDAAASRAEDEDEGEDAEALREAAAALTSETGERTALSDRLRGLMSRHPDRSHATRYERELEVLVDRPRARFSAWYEMFPRSASPQPGQHGTFKDVEARLPYVAGMGFDVLYLPPVHPIGRAFRKGANNSVDPGPGDPGSPWAIGGPEGGHRSVHPQLGTLEDFRRLVRAAARHGLEVALDLAFQVSPDHPYVREHPDWFRSRPDGTIQYAENPPKKYQDIYPFDFDCEDWRALWQELLDVVEFWVGQGVRIFRVDNPHTKPFAFWEWLLGEIGQRHPDLIFLSEAFTRPRVMYQLAKLGFNQSYTYFAWRNEAWELREYLTELTRAEVREYLRPNLWPNTPDILTEALQTGGAAASALRLVLAATLGASYGVYGPVFELAEVTPLQPGREEYRDSEKYQLRHWDLDRKGSLRPLITRVNRIRRTHPALQQDRTLRFLRTDNERLLAYAKTSEDGADVIAVVVNLDPEAKQSGWVEVPVVPRAGSPPYRVEDLLNGARYTWRSDGWNYVALDPTVTPAHVLRVSRPLLPEDPNGA
jgi:starch synthase (maltosyl-transferring)